jgi:opacity protein-like surface antigen
MFNYRRYDSVLLAAMAIATFLATFLATVTIMALVESAYPADLPSRSRVAAPQQPYVAPPSYAVAEPAARQHTLYLGGVGAYALAEGADLEDGTWQAGVVAGYLWRSGALALALGLGVEVDYVLRDLGDIALDDGTASLRGRAGVFLGDGSFLYATAGVARATEAAAPDGFREGLVVGGGIERDVVPGLAVRAEALHYRHADGYFEWGDEGSTAIRAGMVAKF